MSIRPVANLQGDLERWRKEQERIMRTALPRAAGAIAVKGIKEAFRKESYASGGRWQARKVGAPRDKGRNLLVDTGRLVRSVRHEAKDAVVTVYTDVPYAKTHNEGLQVQGSASIKSHTRRTKHGTATVRAHTRRVNFKMPQRQFMPIPGEQLPLQWRKEIEDAYKKMAQKADSAFFGT